MTTSFGLSATGAVVSSYGSAFIESAISDKSINDVVSDTIVNGTIGIVSGKVADKVAKINKGWIRPTKFKTSFTGKYIKKVATNLAVQAVTSTGIQKAQDACKKGANYVKNNYNKAKKRLNHYSKNSLNNYNRQIKHNLVQCRW